MFSVNLYEMNKRENSTQRPSGNGYVIHCEAHEPIDLMSPTFLINLSAPFDYNYLYISIWDRYYWIDNWTYNKGLWEAACSIDPLASWRNDIGNMTEYVLRSSDEFDGGIVDTTYPLTGEVDIVQNFAAWSVEANPSGCYVIGVVGAQGLTEYYWINDYEIDDFGAAMFGNTLWTNVVADDPGVQQGGVPSFMKAQFNPLQYVVSCMWFPFALPHAGSKSHVYFGYFDSGWGAYKLTRDSFNLFSDNIQLNEHPQADARGYYLDLAPYSRLRLSALPWGEIDLDTTKFFGVNSVIYLEAWVDPVTGSTKLYVMNGAGDTLITLVGQIGVPEQLSQVLKDNLRCLRHRQRDLRAVSGRQHHRHERCQDSGGADQYLCDANLPAYRGRRQTKPRPPVMPTQAPEHSARIFDGIRPGCRDTGHQGRDSKDKGVHGKWLLL